MVQVKPRSIRSDSCVLCIRNILSFRYAQVRAYCQWWVYLSIGDCFLQDVADKSTALRYRSNIGVGIVDRQGTKSDGRKGRGKTHRSFPYRRRICFTDLPSYYGHEYVANGELYL